jgi:hypothetical protein
MQLSYTVATILSFSIFIAGLIGIFRFAQIGDIYRPFIYLIWVGFVTEVVSIYFAYVYHNNLIIGAIYRLCESLLLLWFFNRLGVFKKFGKALYALVCLFVVLWLADNFFSSHLNVKLTFYFDIVYAFSVVILSIRAINDLLFTEKELLKNPTFLICIGLIIYFTYKIIERMFSLYGLKESFYFRMNVQAIMVITNCLTNLIFALAVFSMRRRKAFTTQFGMFDESIQINN